MLTRQRKRKREAHEADLVGHLVSRFILQDTRKRRAEREAWVRRGATSVIAANNPCSIAITTNGDVRYSGWCTMEDRERPDDIPGPFVAVAMGNCHSLALRANGDVYCFGPNPQNGPQDDHDRLGPFIAIAGGTHHSVALRANGDAHCWGKNDWGQAPQTVQGPFLAVGAGESHSIGLCENGDIQCWGSRYGFNDEGYQPWLDKIPGPFVAIDAVDGQTVGLRPNGTIEIYGSHCLSEAERFRFEDGQRCCIIRGSFVAISVGPTFLLALDKAGDLQAFGFGWSNQFPKNSDNTAGRAKGPFVAIAAGEYHSQALRADGTIQSWGRVDEADPSEAPKPGFAIPNSRP